MSVSKQLTLLLLILVFTLTSCGDEEPPPPDVSNIDVDLTVLRFDREIERLDSSDYAGEIERLTARYGSFVPTFFTYVIPLQRGDLNPAEQREAFGAYLEYPLTGFVDSLVAERFPPSGDDGLGDELEQQTEELKQALRYYKHYLPGAQVPDTVVTYESHFELAAFLYGEGQLAAGLDFFLGPDFDYSVVNPEEPIFSNYLNQSYTPDHFVSKMMRVLIEDYFPPPRSGRLIDYLIYEGKKLYLLELLQPETPDHIVYEITEEQMEWLRDNETQIYAYLQREDELYSTDNNKVKRYTRPAPSSPGMPAESPGGAVNYLGRQIVAAYLQNNPDVDLPELLALQDGQEILRGARYKPR